MQTEQQAFQAALSPEQMAGMEVIRFPSGTRYAIRFGWKEENDRWKLLEHFVETAKADIPEEKKV